VCNFVHSNSYRVTMPRFRKCKVSLYGWVIFNFMQWWNNCWSWFRIKIEHLTGKSTIYPSLLCILLKFRD
jgi:hypothetical protein